jgi:hypothetical protein
LVTQKHASAVPDENDVFVLRFARWPVQPLFCWRRPWRTPHRRYHHHIKVMEKSMNGGSDDKVVGIEAHRARRQRDEDTSSRTRQDAASSLSLSLLGCWPGMAWLPLPFETREGWRDRH